MKCHFTPPNPLNLLMASALRKQACSGLARAASKTYKKCVIKIYSGSNFLSQTKIWFRGELTFRIVNM